MRKLTKKQIRNRFTWGDALCDSKKATLTLARPDGRMCCLGVLCHSVARVPLADMVGHAAPDEMQAAQHPHQIDLRDLIGCGYSEEVEFIHKNDGNGCRPVPHDVIALYVYLTAHAGEAPTADEY